MATCEGCRFWSKLVAECIGGGPLRAMCLHPKHGSEGEGASSMRIAINAPMTHAGCEDWVEGEPIDIPGT